MRYYVCVPVWGCECVFVSVRGDSVFIFVSGVSVSMGVSVLVFVSLCRCVYKCVGISV